MSSSQRKPTAAIYSALQAMSQGFEQALSAMESLNRAGLKSADLFEGCRLLTEEAAAWACHEVLEVVREQELSNWTIVGRNWQRWRERNEETYDLVHSPKKAQTSKDQARRAKQK